MNKAALVICAVFLLLPRLGGGASAIMEDAVEETHQLGPRGTVTVRNLDGRIHLYASEGPEMKIFALKRAFSQERLDALQVKTTIDGRTAVIDTIYPERPEGAGEDRSGTVDYRIYLPQDCTVELAELANGEILLEGLRGDSATARVGNGWLVARNCFTALDVKVGRGGMDLFYTWWEDAAFSIAAESTLGNIRLGLPPDAAAVVDAATQNGHVRSQFDQEKPPDDHARARQLTIGAGSEVQFRLRATNGNIRIDRSY